MEWFVNLAIVQDQSCSLLCITVLHDVIIRLIRIVIGGIIAEVFFLLHIGVDDDAGIVGT